MRWGWTGLALVLIAPPVWAYRPFVSTDAAITEAHEAELEVGVFAWERAEHANTLVIPRMVFNYGLTHRLEGVIEGAMEHSPHESLQVTDAALSLKTLVKEGALQDQDGPSLALEAGVLLPSTRAAERRAGFEVLGVLSEQLAPMGEVNGESGQQQPAEISGLVGLIWQSPWPNLVVDTGIRRGFTTRADDWQVTAGCTISWPFSRPQRSHAARSVSQERTPERR